MRRGMIATIVVAGMLTMVPALAFAAGSSQIHSGGSSGGGGGSSSGRGGVTSSGTVIAGTGATASSGPVGQAPATVAVDAYGTMTTAAGTITTSKGTIAVKVNGATSDGKTVTYNQATGNVLSGNNVEVVLRTNDSAVAGLSADTVATNNRIEAAGSMAGVVPGMEGSKNISPALNLNTVDPATGIANDVSTEITLKIDFLDGSMQNLVIGGYSNAAMKYVAAQIISVDYAKKLVTFRIPGSGTYWLAAK